MAKQTTKIQTYILSKDRFDTLTKARKWMTDNNVEIKKVDETEISFRFRQFDPDECQAGSFRVITLSKGVQGTICRPKSQKESTHENDSLQNVRGLSVLGTFEAIRKMERKFTQEEANFQQKSPSPDVVCGSCRFFLRDPSEEIGLCQVVAGAIPWFATSDLFISSADEAMVVFEGSEEMNESEDVDIEEGIRPAFGSPGGKKYLAETIVKFIPEHKTYVEPFVGGGRSIFQEKAQ